jgi:hypothetical protein
LGVLTLSIVARLIWRRVDMNAMSTQQASKSTNDILAENYLVTWLDFFVSFIVFYIYFCSNRALKLNNEKQVTQMITKIWSLIFLPLLFSLIGNEIDFQKLTIQLIGNCFIGYTAIWAQRNISSKKLIKNRFRHCHHIHWLTVQNVGHLIVCFVWRI